MRLGKIGMDKDAEILIVEDSSTQAMQLKHILEQHRYKVSVACNGKEALASLNGHNPKVIISDIVMPEMDGYQLCRRIKEDEDLKDISVVLLTSLSDPKDVIRGLECGADSFTTKPYNEQLLISCIQGLLLDHEKQKKSTVKMDMEIFLEDEKFVLTSDTKKITNFLLSTYENVIQKNRELEEANRELKKAQEALQERENRYRLLFNSGNDAIFVHGITEECTPGKFIEVNDVACEVLGYTKEELLKLSSADIDITERTSDVHKIMEKLIADKHILFEKMLVTKDGRKIPVETNAHLFNFNGKPAVLSILRDITDRKRMEEEILKIRKIESLGTLAGGIAHDFNNILTAILGNISLAKMFISPEDKPFKRLSEAERASLRAKDLTRQLLTFTKGGEPVKKTASISELLKESAGFALRGSNCRCEFFIPDNLFPVEMDKGQISQVVNNLVINAKEAMQEGGTIEVLAQNIEEEAKQAVPIPEGKYVKVSIKDYGIGIHEEHISKIFDPYFTTKEKGSGLGLATSYSIIRKHGGHITVESKIGVGTTFTFYLPASRKGVTTKEAIKEAPILGKGMVLVMDDEEMIRDLSVSMLTKLGYEVEVVKDGVEAVESYKKAKESGHPFDVVIMDLTIPGSMGGKEAIKKLLEADSNIKAIVSSGYSNDPIMADYRGYGFSGVIAKPYRIEEISDILNKVMCGCE